MAAGMIGHCSCCQPKEVPQTKLGLARVLVSDLAKQVEESESEVRKLKAMLAQAKALVRLLEPSQFQNPQENPKSPKGWYH